MQQSLAAKKQHFIDEFQKWDHNCRHMNYDIVNHYRTLFYPVVKALYTKFVLDNFNFVCDRCSVFPEMDSYINECKCCSARRAIPDIHSLSSCEVVRRLTTLFCVHTKLDESYVDLIVYQFLILVVDLIEEKFWDGYTMTDDRLHANPFSISFR